MIKQVLISTVLILTGMLVYKVCFGEMVVYDKKTLYVIGIESSSINDGTEIVLKNGKRLAGVNKINVGVIEVIAEPPADINTKAYKLSSDKEEYVAVPIAVKISSTTK